MARTRASKSTKYPPRARKPGVVRITVEAPEKVARRLKSYCALKGLNPSQVVVDAIRARLKGFEVVDGTASGPVGLELVGAAEGERREVG